MRNFAAMVFVLCWTVSMVMVFVTLVRIMLDAKRAEARTVALGVWFMSAVVCAMLAVSLGRGYETRAAEAAEASERSRIAFEEAKRRSYDCAVVRYQKLPQAQQTGAAFSAAYNTCMFRSGHPRLERLALAGVTYLY